MANCLLCLLPSASVHMATQHWYSSGLPLRKTPTMPDWVLFERRMSALSARLSRGTSMYVRERPAGRCHHGVFITRNSNN
jgi:hypothetical protein